MTWGDIQDAPNPQAWKTALPQSIPTDGIRRVAKPHVDIEPEVWISNW
jgi:hypothetical protein